MDRNPQDTPSFSADEAEQLLRGRAFERDDLFELRDFVRTAAATTRMQPSVGAEQRHLAAIAEATRLAPLSGPVPTPRSRTMRSVLRSKVFKSLAGAVAAVVAMGGLAAAQTLPAPAQDAMAAVAERVGINLPHSNEGKRGADHDGDGVADDNGLHTGQTGTKRGNDHDGDGVADDNGLHKGEDNAADPETGNDKTKRGNDHDGDGVADDNGLHKGEDKPDKVKTGKDHDGDGVADDNGRHNGDDNAAEHDSDDEPETNDDQ